MSPTQSPTTSIKPMTAAATEGRVIQGLALPYGVPGHSSRGKVTVNPGSVQWAADLKRIKLYRDHSDASGTPVGYCVGVDDTAEGIKMSFKIGNTPDGDAALADVAEGIRDALSVEIMGADVAGGGVLKGGTITAVALVAVPAFDDARVHNFTAALHTAEAPAPADDTADVDNVSDNETDPEPLEEDEDMTTPLNTKTALAAPADADAVPAAAPTPAAAAPVGLTASRRATPDLTFSSVVDTILGVREGRPTDLMTAALADITRSAHPAVSSAAWLGELWGGVSHKREIVPTMTQKRLTSMRATGWRWTTKPTVDDYAGDKAEIPSNEVATEPVTLTPRRLAGGHDIDRAYVDFNDREFLSSYFAAMTESYSIVSDDRAGQFLALEAANNVGEMQADLLRAAAKARQMVKRNTRTEATSFLVNPDDMFSLMEITTLDNPAYLQLLGIDPAKFLTSDEVEAGTVIAYAKQAVEWHELGSAPIRVEAEHIARGGRDAAVFGYYVPFTANPAGIVQVPFGGGA